MKKTGTIKYNLSHESYVNKTGTIGCAVPVTPLSVFSKQEHVDLLKIIAVKGNEMRRDVTPQFLMVRLHLSKRELNSGIEKLMTIGCVDMINGTYALTSLGKEICEGLFAIEYAIATYNELEIRDEIRFLLPQGSIDLRTVIEICIREILRGLGRLSHFVIKRQHVFRPN